MGITGLLTFLEKASERTNISEFSGGTVAIDTYCWLHKGIYSCAEKVAMGKPTNAYVDYCMKFIEMLLSNKIKPILVFDGRYLPAKEKTDEKRQNARETNRQKAFELMRTGERSKAWHLLARSIDITHEMALKLIKQCQKLNIDCIVAPYEADAQLAYLNISGIADVVITEDSDLTLFGCKKIFFKMDVYGNGLLIDQDKLHLAMDVSPEHFNMDDFCNMCILSGCDYLPSLPGIGLMKAHKFIKINTDCDIHRALTRLGSYLNMKSLVVTKEYRDAFVLAIITFKHQLVFCPLRRKQVRLNPPTPEVTEEQLYYAGTETDPDSALQLALGNWDPVTYEELHNFDPDKKGNLIDKSHTWKQKITNSQCISIWSKTYKIQQNNLSKPEQKKNLLVWPNTASKEVKIPVTKVKEAIATKQGHSFESEPLNQREILNEYNSKDAMKTDNNAETPYVPKENEAVSPVLTKRTNPFFKSQSSPSLFTTSMNRTRRRHVIQFERTVVNEEVVTQSRFFAKLNSGVNDAFTNDQMSLNINTSAQKESSTDENDSNVLVLTANGDIESGSFPMDVDEEHSTALGPSINIKNDTDNSSTYFSCDVKNLSCDTFTRVSEEIESDKNNPSNSNDSLALSKQNVDTDFLVQQGDIDALKNSTFKWSNTKVLVHTSNTLKKNERKNSFSQTILSNNAPIRTRKQKNMCMPLKQQSSLSMFGFEKKKLN